MAFNREIFAIDWRSLRVCRFLFGWVILLDVFNRLMVVREFYSDAGVLPRILLGIERLSPHQVSLFMLSGDWRWAAFLLALMGGMGILLILDIEVRKAAFLLFILLTSMGNRNPHITYGVDILIRTTAFWLTFLPSTREVTNRGRLANFISGAVLFQIVIIYFCAGWLKSSEFWLWNPVAGHYSLSLQYFATLPGRWLLQFPFLLKIGTIWTFLLERFGWLLIFSPWRTQQMRLLTFVLFASLHLNLGVFFDLGLFPIANIVLLTLLIPPSFWDAVTGSERTRSLWNSLRDDWSEQSVAVAFLLIFIGWNTLEFSKSKLSSPHPVRWAMRAFGLTQGWGFFAPKPFLESGWYFVLGKTKSGQRVDPLHQKVHSGPMVAPANFPATLPNRHWLDFLMNVSNPKYPHLGAPFARFLCERWKSKDDPLVSVELYANITQTAPPGGKPNELQELVFARSCTN